MSRYPVEVRIGRLKAAIWRNESENRDYYTVSFSRLHRNEEGEWRSTPSFRRDDLLLLAKLADRAHSCILDLQAEADGGVVLLRWTVRGQS